jgi:hypothetical protein
VKFRPLQRHIVVLALPILLALVARRASAQLTADLTLPDPLVMRDGTTVATAEQWQAARKPELRALFEQYMYGHSPAAPPRVEGRTLFEDASAFGGKGTLREVELTFGPPEWPKIYLLIASPNVAAGAKPAACFVGANFGGNHMRSEDPRIRIPKGHGVMDNDRRGKQAETHDLWPLEEAVGRGYGIATFFLGDVQPDRPEVREGMRATMPEDAAADPAATATVMWWAWGISRAVDYLATDPHVDGKRLAVVGHSRLGKAAMLAGAFDDRIAAVIANMAGCGGSGPSRHDDRKAETVKIITSKFPHWFCDNFKSYSDDTTKLPFDQNCLVAMCAPRPVLFNAAEGDQWANPTGQLEVLKSATPVYKLLGVDGLEAEKMPEPGAPLILSRLGYSYRPGTHAMGEDDWQGFFAFADKWLQ